MDYRTLITIEPGKRGGKPCIRGLRITVYDVLEYLASGMSADEILSDFPDPQEDPRPATHRALRGNVSHDGGAARKATSTSKPPPRALRPVTRAPMRSTRPRTKARPRPVPLLRRVSSFSPR